MMSKMLKKQVKKPKKRNRLADLVKKLPESITDTRRNDKKYIFGEFIGAVKKKLLKSLEKIIQINSNFMFSILIRVRLPKFLN